MLTMYLIQCSVASCCPLIRGCRNPRGLPQPFALDLLPPLHFVASDVEGGEKHLRSTLVRLRRACEYLATLVAQRS